jgi:hypothetical protein
MRSHVRRWRNEWDLKRLYPGAAVVTEEQTLKSSYDEDIALEDPNEGNGKDADATGEGTFGRGWGA